MRCASLNKATSQTEYGASLLEAAIALPIFLGLVLAAISAMQVLYSTLVISEALRQAGRAAAIRTSECNRAGFSAFMATMTRFDVDMSTYEDNAGQPLQLLIAEYPPVASSPYDDNKRAINLTTNVRIRCTLCDTVARFGIVIPGRFSRSYSVPLEDQSSSCAATDRYF